MKRLISALLMWAWACAKVSCGSCGELSLGANAAETEAYEPRLTTPLLRNEQLPAGIEASSEVEGLALNLEGIWDGYDRWLRQTKRSRI